jgi:hypothetical protein
VGGFLTIVSLFRARDTHVTVESTEAGSIGALFEGKGNSWEESAPETAAAVEKKKKHKKQKTSA